MEVASISNSTLTRADDKDAKLWKAAQSLEANFIAEVLKSSGLGESKSEFNGGVGESQFSSFLTNEYAKATVTAGGIGLAESIYQSLLRQDG
ncbi:MAG: rod-binding protein [Gammaproteobacteria bacterium]|nr:rod-binding protein [Gammaproteobacteria bacterium]